MVVTKFLKTQKVFYIVFAFVHPYCDLKSVDCIHLSCKCKNASISWLCCKGQSKSQAGLVHVTSRNSNLHNIFNFIRRIIDSKILSIKKQKNSKETDSINDERLNEEYIYSIYKHVICIQCSASISYKMVKYTNNCTVIAFIDRCILKHKQENLADTRVTRDSSTCMKTSGEEI